MADAQTKMLKQDKRLLQHLTEVLSKLAEKLVALDDATRERLLLCLETNIKYLYLWINDSFAWQAATHPAMISPETREQLLQRERLTEMDDEDRAWLDEFFGGVPLRRKHYYDDYGRLDYTTRPDLLVQLAKALPEDDFSDGDGLLRQRLLVLHETATVQMDYRLREQLPSSTMGGMTDLDTWRKTPYSSAITEAVKQILLDVEKQGYATEELMLFTWGYLMEAQCTVLLGNS